VQKSLNKLMFKTS